MGGVHGGGSYKRTTQRIMVSWLVGWSPFFPLWVEMAENENTSIQRYPYWEVSYFLCRAISQESRALEVPILDSMGQFAPPGISS